MPDVADRAIRSILGRSLLTSAVFARDARRRIVSILADVFRGVMGSGQWQLPVRDQLEDSASLIREQFEYTDRIAWIAGFRWTVDKLPRGVAELVADFNGGPVSGAGATTIGPPPRLFEGTFGEDGPPEIRFPRIEQAAESLLERNVMTRDDFDDATEGARARAFTIAGDLEADTIETIQQNLAEEIRSGTSLAKFREGMDERLKGSFLGDHHLENVYRTNVQAAFRDGRESLVSNPVVSDVFPYQRYIPISDDRTREEHEALGSLGLDGTGVYRRDDPFWDFFTPPWDFNCRCGVQLLTIERAARLGVKEAQRWLDTGRPPEAPQYRIGAIPFPPNPGFGTRGRTGVAA